MTFNSETLNAVMPVVNDTVNYLHSGYTGEQEINFTELGKLTGITRFKLARLNKKMKFDDNSLDNNQRVLIITDELTADELLKLANSGKYTKQISKTQKELNLLAQKVSDLFTVNAFSLRGITISKILNDCGMGRTRLMAIKKSCGLILGTEKGEKTPKDTLQADNRINAVLLTAKISELCSLADFWDNNRDNEKKPAKSKTRRSHTASLKTLMEQKKKSKELEKIMFAPLDAWKEW